MAKNCYLFWQDGELVCGVNHRDFKNCDLIEARKENERFRKLVKKTLAPQKKEGKV